ncbi:IncI1-type conjugal transfer protein TraT, partial [Salmonella enterica subsp. enterica serovar Reading]|nr:IncI1-type conjugal transfer protein TraT [Salmonella enterica subsp. enterica serovar Reading]
MQHSIKNLWLYPFPEIDVVHTQEPLLPEPELTTPGRCICCRQNVRHRFRLDDSWPLRQLTDTISDTRVRLNKATEHLVKLIRRGEPVATGEKEKYNTAVKAAERALEQARLSARRLSLRHVQKAEITSTEPLSEKEQELFHEDGPPYSLCAFCHAWHSLNGYAAAQGVM